MKVKVTIKEMEIEAEIERPQTIINLSKILDTVVVNGDQPGLEDRIAKVLTDILNKASTTNA